MTEFRSDALIALGGNLPSQLGDPTETMIAAVSDFCNHGMQVRAISRFFSTPCFPVGAGPDYVNAVVRVRTNLDAGEMLSALHVLEKNYSRMRDQRWGGRTLDLDLLSVDGRVHPSRQAFDEWHLLPLDEQMKRAPDHLILPHPRIQDRGFVLVPFCDVLPDWLHPVFQLTAAQLCAKLPGEHTADVSPL